MRSRKKPNRLRALIIPEQGIASAMVHELAMLFCHAGFDVFFALSDKAARIVNPELVKTITGNTPLTSSEKPAWLKSRHNFDLSIVFGKESDQDNGNEQHESQIQKSDQIVFLNENSPFPEKLPDRSSFYHCPGQPGEILHFFQNLFAREIRRLHGRKKLQGATFFFSECLTRSRSEIVDKNSVVTD